MSKVIWHKVISKYHNDPMIDHFGIKKMRELIAKKYFWPNLRKNIEVYIKGCDIYLVSKPVKHKLWNLQLFSVLTHYLKDLFMDFVTCFLVLFNWNRQNYDFFLIIVDQLTKIIYYKPIQITINATSLAKVSISILIQHNGLSNSIMSYKRPMYTFKFFSLLYYLFDIKQKLLTVFYLQINS